MVVSDTVTWALKHLPSDAESTSPSNLGKADRAATDSTSRVGVSSPSLSSLLRHIAMFKEISADCV